MAEISIVTPVYNTSKYLSDYFNSILAQTFKNFEVIVIDDGSGDSSLEICREYAAKDNRIKVLTQNKLGVSTARNAGLNSACGEWICFIDSDDCIDNQFFEKLLKYTDNDIVECYIKIFNKNGTIQYSPFDNEDKTMTGQEWQKRIAVNFTKKMLARTVLYRKSVLNENNIRFNPDYYIYEDVDFALHAAKYSKSVYITTEKLYFYRKHSNSLTTNTGISLQRFSSLLFLKRFSAFGIENEDIHLTMANIYLSFYRDAVCCSDVPKKLDKIGNYLRKLYSNEEIIFFEKNPTEFIKLWFSENYDNIKWNSYRRKLKYLKYKFFINSPSFIIKILYK